MSPPTANVLAAAAARRQASEMPSTPSAQLVREHEQRQTFRRLIDPGIVRPNSRQVAMDALKTLSTIAENVLREPNNAKYHTFKHENETIKRRLIEPKGALEYALALGFRPKVIDFQSHYVFHPSRMVDLRIGAAILKEVLDRELEKEARQARSKEVQKAAEAAAAQNVKLAFMDDRKTKLLRDQQERQLREARQSSQGLHGPASVLLSPVPNSVSMPGSGHTLANVVDQEGMDQPPPYDEDQD